LKNGVPMFAVIKTGSKQYRVAENDVVIVEKLLAAAGEAIQFDEVLMIGGDGSPQVGVPRVTSAAVFGEVIEQARGEKIIVFKKHRRKGYRRKRGHQQDLTVVRITEISPTGTRTKAAAKPAAKPKAAETTDATVQLVAEAKKPKAEAKPKAKAKPKLAAGAAPKPKPKAKAKAKAAPKAKPKE
jgi:large subunit ribosomal protein L21